MPSSYFPFEDTRIEINFILPGKERRSIPIRIPAGHTPQLGTILGIEGQGYKVVGYSLLRMEAYLHKYGPPPPVDPPPSNPPNA